MLLTDFLLGDVGDVGPSKRVESVGIRNGH